MATFNLGALSDWERIDARKPVTFDYPVGLSRKLRFELMASAYVEAYAMDYEGERTLLAAGAGRMLIKFSAVGPLVLELQSEDDCGVYIRTGRKPQLMPERDHPSFTTIEPRGVGASSDLKRMMHVLTLNQRARDEAMQAELARLGEKYESDRRALLAERKKPKEEKTDDAEVTE